MNKTARILVTGGNTLLGKALCAELHRQGYLNLLLAGEAEPDWTKSAEVTEFFRDTQPEYVFHAAGKSAGIAGNQQYPADLIYDNLLAGANVVEAAQADRVQRLLYFASSCVYPRESIQPIKEKYLLTGSLEPTNEAYAVAKIAGIKLCQAYRAQHGMDCLVGIPANPFGPEDDFSAENSHVIPALMARFHHACQENLPTVEIWGSGKPKREFIYTPELAAAAILVMTSYHDSDPINLGSGESVAIAELAQLLKRVTGYPGEIRFDPSRPDGMPVKILDSSRLQALGWQPRLSLLEALQETYQWYCETLA